MIPKIRNKTTGRLTFYFKESGEETTTRRDYWKSVARSLVQSFFVRIHCSSWRTREIWNGLKVFSLQNSFFVTVEKLQQLFFYNMFAACERFGNLTPDVQHWQDHIVPTWPFSTLCFQTWVQVSPQYFIERSEMSAFCPEVKWQFTSGSVWRGRPPSQKTSLYSPSQSFWSNWISMESTRTPDLPDWTVMGQKGIQLKEVGYTEGRIAVWLL